MPKKSHVFISYAREDADFAKDIVRHVKSMDLPLWQDVRDLRGGDRWQERIDQAIDSAEALIVVMSPAATRSQYVTYEWTVALRGGKLIIPVVYRPTDLHPQLQKFHYINFATVNGRRPWARLADALAGRRPQSVQANEPVLRARFDFTNGKPSKVKGGEYVIWLWVENAPRTATSVIYEIDDDTFTEPKWTERNPEDEFITWMQSYGDVPIFAQFRNKDRKLSRIREDLVKALRVTHGKTRNAPLRRALKEIDDN